MNINRPQIAGMLLGALFILFGMNFFFKFIPMPKSKPTPEAIAFFTATGSTGFMAFVKVCEILGGILVAMPRTRNVGLLILGPIVINILAFNAFIAESGALFQPPVIVISILSAYLLWSGRRAFASLLS